MQHWEANEGKPPEAEIVNIRFRSGNLDDCSAAESELYHESVSQWDWAINNDVSDIIEYQIIL